jgi:nitroimidazol reductase NimA-like FMN-containing flavoprotein (pyridoxamine 5'-phosphate oxidase superfamily)
MTGSEHWFSSKLRELDREECLRLLQGGRVGRIAFADDSGPDVFPVNYVMDGEDVLIATTAYGSLARSSTNDRVAFEVDELDDFTESGWSVVVRGRATRESPASQTAERPQPWAEGNRTYVMRITPDVISGRRLIPS